MEIFHVLILLDSTENMPELYLKSIDRRWKKEIACAEKSIIFLSPYLTPNTANLVFKNANPKITRLYTVFSFQNFVSGASSIKTLRQLKKNGMQIFHMKKLHAKVLIIDSKFASIGSQNLTFGGTRNREASVAILETKKIDALHKQVRAWIDKSVIISEEMISEAEDLIDSLNKKMQPIINEVTIAEAQYWDDLKLKEMNKKVPGVRGKLRPFRTKNADVSITEEVAKLFIKKSAWWLKHPSGSAVRAPRHQHNVYGSNPDWKIDFGANTFLVGRAIQRCLNTIESALEKISKGELVSYQDIRDRMSLNVRGAIANYDGYEYEGYYSAIEGNDMVFGTQSIDISDFINCAIELTRFDSVFTEPHIAV